MIEPILQSVRRPCIFHTNLVRLQVAKLLMFHIIKEHKSAWQKRHKSAWQKQHKSAWQKRHKSAWQKRHESQIALGLPFFCNHLLMKAWG